MADVYFIKTVAKKRWARKAGCPFCFYRKAVVEYDVKRKIRVWDGWDFFDGAETVAHFRNKAEAETFLKELQDE